MQWIANSGAALGPLLPTSNQVEFHISEQPCAAYCAQRIIQYWAGLATAGPHCHITSQPTRGPTSTGYCNDGIVRLT